METVLALSSVFGLFVTVWAAALVIGLSSLKLIPRKTEIFVLGFIVLIFIENLYIIFKVFN